MDNYNKLFMIIRKTDLLNYDEKNELQLYLMNLKEQVKKQKEVINKATMYINLNKQKTICAYGDNEDDDFEIELWEEDIDKLLDILKEVSE